jgi:hypothetical protein
MRCHRPGLAILQRSQPASAYTRAAPVASEEPFSWAIETEVSLVCDRFEAFCGHHFTVAAPAAPLSP